ncbi:MAG: response regulator [Treponema sp.]|jgi:CheY-like chemotaxis protein|nr:response regulator [Treponema sp.]
MENLYNRRFDFASLLKINDIDLRMAARLNPTMFINEYFHLLSRFINQTANLVITLDRIAALQGEKYDFQIVSSIEEMMNNMGCNKFMTTIDEIVKSGKMGHKEFSALYAEKLSRDIYDLCTRLKKAEKKSENKTTSNGSPANNQTGESPDYTFEELPLSKFLAQLEHEEATRKMRILAIDDSPVMLQTISSVLSEDYTVYRLANPTMLEKILKQITPELFLLDYKMPELSGFDLIPIIRSFEEHQNTPIVFLTSEGASDYVTSALTLGARDYIVKPFQPDTLREKVARHIVRKNLLEKRAA